MNKQELHDVMMAALTAVAPDVDPTAVDPAADLTDQLDIDSMDFLNIVVAVHEQTGIDIPERDYPKLSTLDGAVDYLAAAQQRLTGGDA
jgi:acyl carrier protein